MTRLEQYLGDDVKNEVVVPMMLVIALIIGLWLANDGSFVLPHYL